MNEFEIARDDFALDAIAAGRAPDHADEALSLLHALRTDLEPVAVVPSRRRRAWPYVAVAAAAGLVFGGVVVSDQPGRPLYNIHRVVLGDADDPHAAQVSALLDRAAGRLANRDRAGTRRLLADAARQLPSVSGADRAALRARYDALVILAAEPSPAPSHTPEATHTNEPEREHESPAPTETHSEGSDDGGHSGTDDGH